MTTLTMGPDAGGYHYDIPGTVDYVWYTRDNLRCMGVLEMPLKPELDARVALPTEGNPSDHMLLCTKFRLTPT